MMLIIQKYVKESKSNRPIFSSLLVAMLAVLYTGSAFSVDEPNEVQIRDKLGLIEQSNDYKNGAFDIEAEKSTIVSAAAQGLFGHYPGIRTIATVDNSDGELRICSVVTAHYQLVDLDGDWDSSLTSVSVDDGDTSYTHLKTSETIVWYLADPEQPNLKPVEVKTVPTEIAYADTRNVSIRIPAEIDMQDGKGLRSTKGLQLQYKITPWTMIGSVPRTLGESPSGNFSLDNEALTNNWIPVYVDNLTSGKFLEPNSFLGRDAVPHTTSQIMSDLTRGAFTFPGFNPPNTGTSFIKTANIVDADECTNNPYLVYVYNHKNERVDLSTGPTVFVNSEYRVEVLQLQQNGESSYYKRITDEPNVRNNIIWELYKKNEVGAPQRVASTGLSADAQGDLGELRSDPNFQPLVESQASITGRLDEGTLKFKTQASNQEGIYRGEPHYSEQGLLINAVFVTDD